MKVFIITEFFSGYPSGMKLYGVFTSAGIRKLKRKEIYKRLREHLKLFAFDVQLNVDDYNMYKDEVDKYIKVTEVEIDTYYNDYEIEL